MKYSINPCKLYLIALLSLVPVSIKAQEVVSLQQAIETTLQNNLDIKQSRLNEELSRRDLSQSKFALLPSVNANSNLYFNEGRTLDPTSYTYVDRKVNTSVGNISSGIVLFQGFQKLNQIAQNKYLLDSDKSYTNKVKNDLTLRVIAVYLSVLGFQDQLKAAKQQFQVAKEQMSREQKFLKAGTKTMADVYQAQTQMANAELRITNAENQRDLAWLELAQLMERDPSKPFSLTEPTLNAENGSNNLSAENIYQKALSFYPDVKAAEYNKLASAKGIKAARGFYYPTLSLVGGLGTNYSSRNFTSTTTVEGMRQIGVTASNEDVFVPQTVTQYSSIPVNSQLEDNLFKYVGFNLSIPIFNGNLQRTSVQKARITYQASELTERQEKNRLNKIINQAVWDLKAASKNYNSAVSAYRSSKETFNVIEQRFSVGLVNSFEYNQSQADLYEAEIKMIEAKYDQLLKSNIITFYYGNSLSF